jgi:hypothetical protein
MPSLSHQEAWATTLIASAGLAFALGLLVAASAPAPEIPPGPDEPAPLATPGTSLVRRAPRERRHPGNSRNAGKPRERRGHPGNE